MPDPKPSTPREAAAVVRAVDRIGMPLGPGIPSAFLHALGERDDFEALVVFGALLLEPFALFTRAGVSLRSGFFGPVERGLRAAGHDVEFVPAGFRDFVSIARRLAPRVVATVAAPPDAEGRLSLSLHAGATVEEIHRAAADPERLLVVETSAAQPRTCGLPPEHPHSVALADVDVWIESDREPFVLPDAPSGPAEHAIAEIVSRYVGDGATLQTGIGGIPNDVVKRLAEGSGGDYGIHSEMFTTGLMTLHRAGKVSNRKGIFDGSSIATFAMGTRELYDWLEDNEAVRFLPVGIVNDPGLAARNRRMVSINGALAVDLYGQVAADALDHRQYSGIGGHEDFVMSAAAAPDGHSLVCLPATARANGAPISRIVPALGPGTLVTTPRHHVDVVITEFGAAELSGRTVPERARALSAVAAPEFREPLLAQADRIARRA